MKIKQTALAVAGALSLAIVASPAAHAVWVQADHVEGTVSPSGDPFAPFRYSFTVFNDSTDPCFGECNDRIPIIVDWELPYFSDMGIVNIFSPSGWSSMIETVGVPNPTTGWSGDIAWASDPAWIGTPYETVTQVLHWYVDGGEGRCSSILPGDSCGGFGFDAKFGPTDAPYQTSWDLLPLRVGDPPFPIGVGSPCALGQCAVPEPDSLGLLGIGIAAAAAAGLRRRKKQD